MIYSSGAWLGSLIPNPEPNSWMKRTAAVRPAKFQKANANVGGCTTLKQARGARGFWDGITCVFSHFPCDPEPEGQFLRNLDATRRFKVKIRLPS